MNYIENVNELLGVEAELILAGCIDCMVYVEGGTYWMGDDESGDKGYGEKPAHQVRVDSFYIGQFPVTQQFWEALMRNNRSHFKGNRRPVEWVSWEDTQQFFEKLNQLTGLRYRLPTEAEWEFAASEGNRSLGYKYAGSDLLDEVGWFRNNSDDETREVGSKLPNELGLYDMSGNVREWCEDYYSETYYQRCFDKGIIENPKNTDKGKYFVLRGGSWLYNPNYCRVFSRDRNLPNSRNNNTGFRCARNLLPTVSVNGWPRFVRVGVLVEHSAYM